VAQIAAEAAEHMAVEENLARERFFRSQHSSSPGRTPTLPSFVEHEVKRLQTK
jgi:hypothetical protein